MVVLEWISNNFWGYMVISTVVIMLVQNWRPVVRWLGRHQDHIAVALKGFAVGVLIGLAYEVLRGKGRGSTPSYQRIASFLEERIDDAGY